MNFDIIVIGGGILGFSTAMQLLERDPSLKIAVIEKEPRSAVHQTGHNSGVIHAGVYYEPGSLKAKFCVEGAQQIKAFCQQHAIPFKVPGKLIVATEENELSRLNALAERCVANGLTVQHLNAKQATALQPGLNTVGAFLVTETGIVDWKQVCHKYAELFQQAGGKIYYGEQVCKIVESSNHVSVTTQNNLTLSAEFLISCAGLYADRIVKMSGIKPDFKIVPFRGEYYRLNSRYNDYFNYLIYPVPDPALPFLGVHFTPQVGGYTTIGPNAVLALAREGYRWRDVNLKDMVETFSYLPAWKMLAKHFKATCHEFRDSISKASYVKLIQRYFPEIKGNDITSYPAGVRAQAIGHDGVLAKDFIFSESGRMLHVCNAPSPAATSSLPIGKYIADKLSAKLVAV